MKNVTCSRLGTMLHLDIQKEKDDMKTSEFQKYLGSTTTCTKRLAIYTEGCDQLTSNETYFADNWYSSIKTAKEEMAAGVDYCRQVKTSHKVFCLATSETLMEDWLVGSYLVMKSTPRVPGGRPTMAIGYKYNHRKVL